MQIVGYDTGANRTRAALLVADDGDVHREPLVAGRTLTYTLETRHCAGTIEGDSHIPCSASDTPYCQEHTDRWPCARCRGDCRLPLESCREEHAIYLAAFAPDTFKVGVTRSWRLETRLREQGADRGAHIRTVANGRIARQIEADIATTVGDSVRVEQKLAGLHRSVDETAWNQLLAAFEIIEQYDFEYGLAVSERPVAETVLSGTIRGTKGRLLVVDHNDSTYGIDLKALVGYEISEGTTDRSLQASLGSFG